MSALTLTVALTDTTLGLTRRADNVAITTSAGNIDLRTPSIGTSEEEHTFIADIGNAGQLYMRNLDTTNYVEWGTSTGVYPFRLNPSLTTTNPPGGPPAVVQLAAATASLFFRANTAACRVEILVHEA